MPKFATAKDAEACDAWFRAKVEKAITSSAHGIPHDKVMAQAEIEKYRPRL